VTTASTKISNVVSVQTHTPLTGGTTYYYKLAAVKSGVEGALSNEVSAAPYSYPAPTVSSISPSSGSSAGGTAVTITGTGFVSGATVSIGGASATGVTFGSATSLTATTPAGATGTQNVMVTNPDGQIGTLTGGFSFGSPPRIGDLDVWLDASDPSTRWTDTNGAVKALANGDLIQVLVDKSSNQRQFSQSTSSLRPTLNTTATHLLNGRPGILFNAKKLDGSQGIVGQSEITFVGVWKIISSTGESFVWMGRNSRFGSASEYGYPFTYSTKNIGHRAAWSDVQITPTMYYTNSALASGHIFSTRLNSSGCNFYFNSTPYTWVNAPNNSFGCGWSVMNFNSSAFDLGQTGVSSTAQFVLYEMLLYKKYLSDDEMSLLINYLNSKWSIY
jgi:hypothetical protein